LYKNENFFKKTVEGKKNLLKVTSRGQTADSEHGRKAHGYIKANTIQRSPAAFLHNHGLGSSSQLRQRRTKKTET